MELEEIKTSFSNLSITAVAIIFSILAASGGAIYVGITTYNRVIAATEAIENFQQYDDKEIKSLIVSMQRENAELKTEVNLLNASVSNHSNSISSISTNLINAQGKSSEAIGIANEAKVTAQGSARETQAALSGVREELKATKEGIEAKMKALQKATTNPLGN